MEILGSSIAITTAGIQASKVTKGFYDDYKHADKHMLHAERQVQQVQLNRNQLNELPSSKKDRIGPVLASLEDVRAPSSTTSHPSRKRDRLKWAAGRKSEVEREITQNHRAESSLAVNLLLSLYEDIAKIEMESASRQREIAESLQLYRNVMYTYSMVSKLKIRERRAAQIYFSKWWLANALGIKLGYIVSKTHNKSAWNIFVRWHLKLPLGLGRVVAGQAVIRDFYHLSLPNLGLRPQNIIPQDSDIIDACENGEILRIQDILSAKKAHPNDRTPDNLTVFRYAVRSGNPLAVQLLLEHGADPNLPYGIFETSPLDSAFYIGNVEIIRLLFNAKAELEYKNYRTWTAVSYLWDPKRPACPTTAEIIEACTLQNYDAWNDTDVMGWTLCHRAAAHGRGDDIRNLECKSANLHMYTTEDLWGPMSVAAWYDNTSTFDAFMDLLPVEEVIGYKDNRGFSLLHMAAQNGNEYMMGRLLDAWG